MNEREDLIREFLDRAGWADAARRTLAGDASTRRYERLRGPRGKAVLMDWPRGPDGPPIRDGRSYSAIAHLAEDCRAFVAVGECLRGWGLRAPALLAHDLEAGLLLLEDLGDELYGALIDRGEGPAGEPLDEIYRAALDVLLEVHSHAAPDRLPLPDGTSYVVPAYDDEALAIETELLTDWYLPAMRGKPTPESARSDYRALWASLFAKARSGPAVLTLRDFHSPNLLWLGASTGTGRVGLIDYQDSVIGPRAYDVASMLQDARRDVPPAREAEMLDYYVGRANAADPSFDAEAFRAACAIMGAQRNSKIVGIFVRLWQRDGKPGYLAHIPRVLAYLERDLAHPALSDLKQWLDGQVSPAERQRLPGPK